MFKFLIFVALSFSAVSTWASPNLEVIRSDEWKGVCRSLVNADNNETSAVDYVRVQSSYTYQDQNLVMLVKSFSDPDCTKIFQATRTTLKCDSPKQEDFATCKAVHVEASKNGAHWQTRELSGNDSAPVRVQVSRINPNKAKITTATGSDHPESENLFRNAVF